MYDPTNKGTPDIVPESADELTPALGLPGLLAARAGTFLSPEVGPVALFSQASDASTHFSPDVTAAPAPHEAEKAATASSQLLFSPGEEVVQLGRLPSSADTPNHMAVERCIALMSRSPTAASGPSPAVSPGPAPSVPSSCQQLDQTPSVATSPGPAAAASPGPPVPALRWPAGSYGLDSDGAESDGGSLTEPVKPDQTAAYTSGGSYGLSQTGQAQYSGPPPAAVEYRGRRGREGRGQTRSKQRSGDKVSVRERQSNRGRRDDREDSVSDTRHQLSLLSRLRQTLNRLQIQLDDDGESITMAKLRELKNRVRPCSAALESLTNGYTTKDVSRRLAKVQEVSDTLLLRIKMLETRCRPTDTRNGLVARSTAGRRVKNQRRDSRSGPFGRSRRRGAVSLAPPPPDFAPSTGPSPSPPSPGSPILPADDDADSPKQLSAKPTSLSGRIVVVSSAAPSVAASSGPLANTAAPAATAGSGFTAVAAAPTGGAFATTSSAALGGAFPAAAAATPGGAFPGAAVPTRGAFSGAPAVATGGAFPGAAAAVAGGAFSGTPTVATGGAFPGAAATAVGGAFPRAAATVAGGAFPGAAAGPWFWQWPMGLPAGCSTWLTPPPWFGPMPWDRQPPPPATVSASAPPPTAATAPPPTAAIAPPPVFVSASATETATEHAAERTQSSAEQQSSGEDGTHNIRKMALTTPDQRSEEMEEVAESSCQHDSEEADEKEDRPSALRQRCLLLRLRTVRLVDDCELVPLTCPGWDRPETLLDADDEWWS
ncbi:pneumococcal serine-rich repeat protein-like isoform X2 [Amphibalanus amphitrite]|uniref:pneumococcal serine-rich repeat protein-like isoform X2 n=1 Tax=Amphibalanus amphitrite TaxID=1232801 RepID=UPI001C900ACE|nr:pneumococcal serine-rich repeat protein-like isoform X2 [Amphibalanus amphitrite]